MTAPALTALEKQALDQDEIHARLKKLPKEVVVVPDFVSLVGSAAEGKAKPNDIDILVRAKEQKGGYLIQAENVWLPIRNLLDPEKEGGLQFIPSPQGPHGDNVALFDLVLRRKDQLRRRVVKDEHDLPRNARGWTTPETLAEAAKQDGGKFSQDASNYRRKGEAPEVCGACRFYLRDPDSEVGRCQVVAGPILWFATSDLYIGAEDEAEAVLKQGEDFAPGIAFTPPRPAERDAAKRFEIDELWEWAEGRLPIAIEPKHNGLRAIAEKRGDEIRLWFEGSRDRDRLASLPRLVTEALHAIPLDFVLDLDIGIEKRGARLGRPALDELTADMVGLDAGERIVLTAFDLPFAGDQDLHDKPFRERRDALEEFFIGQLSGKGDDLFRLSPVRWVDSRREFEAAVRWGLSQDRSEGVVAKAETGRYELDGSTSSQAKLKRVAELKIVVLDVQRSPDGTLVYTGGLTPSDSPTWANLTKLGDEEFVDLGKTLPTKIQARSGDVLTVQVLELSPVGEELVWSGAVVVDRDAAREGPFTTNQSLGIAERAMVLQKAADDFLPATMPTRAARVSFVTTDPSPLELARDEPLVGAPGRVFADVYLPALGLEKSEVAVIPAIPIPMDGRPSVSEAVQWRGWVAKQLERSGGVVVALGRVARAAAGDLADFTLPHPAAVLKRGDNGEVARKARAIRKAISEPNAGLPTADARRARAVKQGGDSWLDNWFDVFPPSGEGKFGPQPEALAKVADSLYEMGVWRESSLEFFLKDSNGLTGRYLFARTEAADGDRRPWILRKQNDQTPIAETEDVEKVLAELRHKRQKWLIWGKPGQRPQKINVRTGRVEKDIRIPIVKAEKSKGIVYGVVLDPYQADLHGDWIPPADVEEAAHRFMERGQKVNLRHRAKLDAVVMESTLVQYPSEDDYQKAMAGEEHSIYEMPYGDQMVRSGTWILGVLVRDPKARAQVESGELDAFSIEGLGIRRPATRSEVPTVRIIQLKPAA